MVVLVGLLQGEVRNQGLRHVHEHPAREERCDGKPDIDGDGEDEEEGNGQKLEHDDGLYSSPARGDVGRHEGSKDHEHLPDREENPQLRRRQRELVAEVEVEERYGQPCAETHENVRECQKENLRPAGLDVEEVFGVVLDDALGLDE